MTEYTSIKIPKVLAERIKQIAFPLGYRSVSEFIIDSARWLLRKIEDKIQKVIQKCRWSEHNYKSILQCTVCENQITSTMESN